MRGGLLSEACPTAWQEIDGATGVRRLMKSEPPDLVSALGGPDPWVGISPQKVLLQERDSNPWDPRAATHSSQPSGLSTTQLNYGHYIIATV